MTDSSYPQSLQSAVQEQLEKICTHPLFAHAERLKRLLRFTVMETLAGRAASLKEHTIGVEVFDRALSYEPGTDSTVRVYVARLRSKLVEYYATAGQQDEVLIEIPKGGYAPVFRIRSTGADEIAPTRIARTPKVRWVAAGALLVLAAAGLAAFYWFTPPPAPMPSIAVLPFVSMSAGPDAEYFSDGLSEEITNALSQLNGLRVVSRTSAFQFRDKPQDVRAIGEQLNVGAVLEGSVRRDGAMLRITAQLIDTQTGYHIWSHTFDRAPEQIFSTQDEIAKSVVQVLYAKLLSGRTAPLVRNSTENIEAYDLYLKGRYAWNRWTAVGFEKAIVYFEQAIAADPKFAPAYAGLANSYALLALYGVLAPLDAMPKARQFADKSIEIDDMLAEGHCASGLVKFLFEWDREGSLRELEKAIALNPGYADAHHYYAHALVLSGRFEAGVAEIQLAHQLDPLALVLDSDIGWTYYLTRDNARAERQLNQTLALDPDFSETLYDLGITYIQARRFSEAVQVLEKARSVDPTAQILGALGHAYASAGRSQDARGLVTELETQALDHYVAPGSLAVIMIGLGNAEAALDWLDRAVEQRDPFVLLLEADSIFDPLRQDPRFTAIEKTVGLR